MSRSYKQMIEYLADGLCERQGVIKTPRINDKFPQGMDAVEAALQAIDDLVEELEWLRNSRIGS